MSDIWKIVVKQKFFRQDNAKDFKVEHWQRHTFSKKKLEGYFRSQKSKCCTQYQIQMPIAGAKESTFQSISRRWSDLFHVFAETNFLGIIRIQDFNFNTKMFRWNPENIDFFFESSFLEQKCCTCIPLHLRILALCKGTVKLWFSIFLLLSLLYHFPII